jgi:hypothetical protein
MTDAGLTDFEVSGTITTGVMVWCPDCATWFAEWSSRQLYPNVQQIVDACAAHRTECPP